MDREQPGHAYHQLELAACMSAGFHPPHIAHHADEWGTGTSCRPRAVTRLGARGTPVLTHAVETITAAASRLMPKPGP